MPFSISSPAFRHEQAIPIRYTCEGENCSPTLHWTDPPDGAKSLALVVVDPDAPDPKAPKTTFTHWLLYNLPPETRGLSEKIADNALPHGTKQGMTDFGDTGYGGPCPPIGRHRYFFKLYALDIELPDLGTPKRADLERAFQNHVIDEAQLMGTYEKQQAR